MFFLSRIFRRKPKIEKPGKVVNKIVVGLIIGGAIASIIGKSMLDERKEKKDEDKKD